MEIYGYVYMVKNRINGKIYFGITVNDFNTRYYGNIAKNTSNEHLKNSIEKYGIENFEVNEQFDIAYNENDLYDLEDMYMCIYNTLDPRYGYNKRRSGSKHKGYGHFDHTDETKQKMSESANVSVVCLNTRKVFRSMVDAMYWVDGRTDKTGTGNISLCCTGDKKRSYRHPETGEYLTWAYYNDYIQMTEQEINDRVAVATEDAIHSAERTDFQNIEDKNIHKNSYELSFETLNVLNQALHFLTDAQLHIFKQIALEGKTLEEVGNEIGRRKESVGRTYKQVIDKIQQKFTVEQFKEILY